MAEPALLLRYSHNVVEHLGLKLYQNRPTNVIAELISNAWDADATNVYITASLQSEKADERFISVVDDGSGMTGSILNDSYLIIGKPKRPPNRLDQKTTKQRPLMGRKGIGKLSPFGIAKKIDLATISEGRFTWFRMDLGKITEGMGEYPPLVFFYEADEKEDLSIKALDDPTKSVAQFFSDYKGKTGTIILLTDLSLKRAISIESIKESVGRRFTVTLLRPDFSVYINGEKVEETQALPQFEFRIPTEGCGIEKLPETGREVKYWAGFVKRADWPQDQAGVGVYTHGKIAQDRPFTFGVKGREIFTRYMYAVIEADWLDELPDDLVSTDRTSINWEHDETSPLYKWGQKKVNEWTTQFKKWREGLEERELDKVVKDKIDKGEIPKITETERKSLVGLLSQVTPNLDKDEETRDRLILAGTQAWLHRPIREMIKKIWDGTMTSGLTGDQLSVFIEKLNEHSVPESLSLAVSFAQRGYALSLLYELIHHKREVDLQKLIESFPWILHPDMEKLTANQQLKTTAEKAAKEGLIPSRTNPISSGADPEDRADFVFFTNVESTKLVIVEIKNPRNDLTIENREQLTAYMAYFEQLYGGKTIIEGKLIGSNPKGVSNPRKDVTILCWQDVFIQSRHGHIELLAAMLAGAYPDPNDARLKEVIEFGGEQTWELLDRMAKANENLNDLFRRFGNLRELKTE